MTYAGNRYVVYSQLTLFASESESELDEVISDNFQASQMDQW